MAVIIEWANGTKSKIVPNMSAAKAFIANIEERPIEIYNRETGEFTKIEDSMKRKIKDDILHWEKDTTRPYPDGTSLQFLVKQGNGYHIHRKLSKEGKPIAYYVKPYPETAPKGVLLPAFYQKTFKTEEALVSFLNSEKKRMAMADKKKIKDALLDIYQLKGYQIKLNSLDKNLVEYQIYKNGSEIQSSVGFATRNKAMLHALAWLEKNKNVSVDNKKINNMDTMKTIIKDFDPKLIALIKQMKADKIPNYKIAMNLEKRFDASEVRKALSSFKDSRIVSSVPKGYVENKEATTVPKGYKAYTNNKSYFSGKRDTVWVKIKDSRIPQPGDKLTFRNSGIFYKGVVVGLDGDRIIWHAKGRPGDIVRGNWFTSDIGKNITFGWHDKKNYKITISNKDGKTIKTKITDSAKEALKIKHRITDSKYGLKIKVTRIKDAILIKSFVYKGRNVDIVKDEDAFAWWVYANGQRLYMDDGFSTPNEAISGAKNSIDKRISQGYKDGCHKIKDDDSYGGKYYLKLVTSNGSNKIYTMDTEESAINWAKEMGAKGKKVTVSKGLHGTIIYKTRDSKIKDWSKDLVLALVKKGYNARDIAMKLVDPSLDDGDTYLKEKLAISAYAQELINSKLKNTQKNRFK